MKTRTLRTAFALALAIAATHTASARAQYGYPGGYRGYGWGGWGGGGETPQGSIARGMGAYAAGAGYYNQQTAVARSINVDTAMRYNQYMYESNQEANRLHHAKLTGDKADNLAAYNKTQTRLRENPSRQDIYAGDALNAAVEQIEDPRVYSRSLQGSKAKIGGKMIRNIPFRYAPGAITVSIQRLIDGSPPPVLMTETFEEDRAAFKSLGQEIRKDLKAGEKPNPETVDKALAIINAGRGEGRQDLAQEHPRSQRSRQVLEGRPWPARHAADPALDILLAGVEEHPEATLGQLLAFMSAYNLRFGEATTPTQKAVYDSLYPMLAELRAEVAPASPGSPRPRRPATRSATSSRRWITRTCKRRRHPARQRRAAVPIDAPGQFAWYDLTWRADNAFPGRRGND